jgi:Zn-dependent protease with chaperone function
MDFFAAQAAAKRRTSVLVFLFVLGWAGTIALADLGISLVLSGTAGRVHRGVSAVTAEDPDSILREREWTRFGSLLLPVALGVSAVVLIGIGWHAVQLGSDGGDAVARMLGGVPVDRSSQDPGERRAVNVLEEMAIAAAIPVPRLYVLPQEPSINAFAAGTSPERAVVAVSRGALDALSRDELQGVLAHELSHVLNHDSRLNVRLMVLVGGLTALALTGRIVLELAGRGRYRSREKDNSGLAFLAVGLILLAAGAIGALFGRLIRLAVSRQREFLADAAAVQFTRNPAGLVGALTKILEHGSALATPHAPEAAHFFFASGLGGFTAGLLSTHPPLEERIRRIQAGPLAAQDAAAAGAVRPAGVASAAPRLAVGLAPAAGLAPTSGLAPMAATATAAVGRLAPEQLSRATRILSAYPAALVEAARQTLGAEGIALALLLDADESIRARQLAAVPDPVLRREAERLSAAIAPVPAQERLGLVDLALPTLDGLTAEQAGALVRALSALAAADGRVTLYEWALQRLVRRRLGPQLGAPRPAVRARVLEQVEVEALELLSALAWVGQRDPAAAQRALDVGARALSVKGAWRILPRDGIGPERLDALLTRLDEASPPLKAQLLGAAAACVLADGQVTAGEANLLRAVAGSLGLPMPGLPVAAGPAASAA